VSYFGYTFRVPTTWRSFPYVENNTAGSLLGYRSTDVLHDPCISGVCNTGTPLDRLSANGVLIIFGAGGGVARRAWNTTIAGQQAVVAQGPATEPCSTVGGATQISAQMATSPHQSDSSIFSIYGCFAGPQPEQAERELDDALATARHSQTK
jgi:hypothetical protein